MSSGMPPSRDKQPVQDDVSGETSLTATIVQDLETLIHDNWTSFAHSEQPWDSKDSSPSTARLRAIQQQSHATKAGVLLASFSPSPLLIPHQTAPTTSISSYTISPAIPALLRGPATNYLTAHPGTTNLLASAAVFHKQRLLLVQRAPTDFFPLAWELPGGSVDVTGDGGVNDGGDASIVAGAVRELWEETGLMARAVKRAVGGRDFEGGRWRQEVFEVESEAQVEREEGLEVRLDPKEHVAWLWVTEREIREGRCGAVVLEYADIEWQGLLLRAFEGHCVGKKLRVFGLDGFW